MDAKSLDDFKKPNVVLLHGIGRTHHIMSRMESYLRHSGYNVFNVSYPSTKQTVEASAEFVYQQVKDLFLLDQPMHFVGHSMGSIVTRYLLTQQRPKNLGRVVMLAPPNNGTVIVHWLRKTKIFQKVYGPASLQLAADASGICHQLPPVDYETGIIAGDQTFGLILWLFLDKPNDGKVTVESAKVEGMSDFIVLPCSHPFFPYNRSVRRQVLTFLNFGKFNKISSV